MKRLGEYIIIIDGALPKDFCDTMIEKFERVNLGDEKRVSQIEWDADYRQFTELNITSHEDFKEELGTLTYVQCGVYNKYREVTGAKFLIPLDGTGFEGIRMKKYAANDYDQFGWHADVGDSRSCKRALAMFTYLNDVEEGGETVFSHVLDAGEGLTIKPKAGRMVIFPPM